jgi:peptidoglycan-associated lipoprotein
MPSEFSPTRPPQRRPLIDNAMKMHRFALAALAAAALAGCSTTKLDETPKAPVETRPTAPVATPTPTAPVAESKVQTVDLAAELTKAVADKRVIYFDYDSFMVKEEFRPTVDVHAKRLNQIKTQRVSLEGHADDRGSREYNLALGQKRAEAVAQQLNLAGVTAAQAEPVSFGKERPAVQGSGEAVWAKNRRVEVKDK